MDAINDYSIEVAIFARSYISFGSFITINNLNLMNHKHPIPLLSKILLLVLFLIPLIGTAQDKVTLSGYIKDSNSGETLIGANVFVVEIGNGATTNEYGFYSVSGHPDRFRSV